MNVPFHLVSGEERKMTKAEVRKLGVRKKEKRIEKWCNTRIATAATYSNLKLRIEERQKDERK